MKMAQTQMFSEWRSSCFAFAKEFRRVLQIIFSRQTLALVVLTIGIIPISFPAVFQNIITRIPEGLKNLPVLWFCISLVGIIIILKFDVVCHALKKYFWSTIFTVIALGFLAFVEPETLASKIIKGSGFFLFSEILLIVKRWTKSDSSEEGLDEPLKLPDKDRLGSRKGFAANVFKLIKDGNYERIAILGPWGSGKTTCLNFITHYARQENYPVVKFSPWKFHNKEEAWKGFVNAVDQGFAEHWKIDSGPFRQNRVWRAFWHIIEKLFSLHKFGRLFNNLFMAKIKDSLTETKKKVEIMLQRELGEKKLIVFIDDLDRSLPEVAYDIFVLLKEVFDIKRCVFVCALDWDVTLKVLKRNFKIQEPASFLGKIYQLRLDLPDSRPEYRYIFINELLERPACGKIKKENILELIDVLPENPRKLKNYLYKLNAFEVIMSGRYDDQDFNWKAMYLAELLKTEFPRLIEFILDKGLLGIWMADPYTKIAPDESGQQKNEIEEKFISAPEERKRFNQLMAELRKVRYRVTDTETEAIDRDMRHPDDVKYYFRILSYPEILTGKEYREWENLSKEKVMQRLLDNQEPLMRRREFLLMLMRERDRVLDNLADAKDTEEEMKPLLDESLAITKMCQEYVNKNGLHAGNHPLFNIEVFEEWVKGCRKWAHFEDDFYCDIRKEERDLAISLAEKNTALASEILNNSKVVSHNNPGIRQESDRAFQSTAEQIQKILKTALAEQLLNGFEKDGSIYSLWPGDESWAEKYLLLQLNDDFYNDQNKQKLRKLIEDAKQKTLIRDNFLELLRLLFHYIDRSDVNTEEIFKHDDWREIIWTGATCRRLNRRRLGSLLESREKVVQKLQRTDSLRFTDWMKRDEPELVQKYTGADAIGTQ